MLNFLYKEDKILKKIMRYFKMTTNYQYTIISVLNLFSYYCIHVLFRSI